MNKDHSNSSQTSLSGYEALTYLQSFRHRCFEAFGERAEFSDALWFATWSGGAVGGSLARGLVSRSSSALFKLWVKTLLQTVVQGLFRVRDPYFQFSRMLFDPGVEAVVQTWRSSEDALKNPIPDADRFFGTRFQDLQKSGKLQMMDIITDNISPMKALPNTFIARSKNVGRFDLMTFGLCVFIWIRTFFSFLRLVSRSQNLCEVLGTLIVWTALPNQRSRHGMQLYQDLGKNLEALSLASTSMKIPNLYLPYECHPEQNAIAAAWQKYNGKVTGYIHGTMLTFPGHYIRPFAGAADELWVHGSAYEEILRRIGWKNTVITSVPAYRFMAMPSRFIDPGSLFFPYLTGNFDDAIERIETAHRVGLLQVKVLKPHPSTGLSPAYKSRFESLMKSPVNIAKTASTNDSIIAIGPVSVVLEELERKNPLRIIHVPLTREGIDSFDQDLWKDYLDVRAIAEDLPIYEITLKVNAGFINLS